MNDSRLVVLLLFMSTYAVAVYIPPGPRYNCPEKYISITFPTLILGPLIIMNVCVQNVWYLWALWFDFVSIFLAI